MPQATNEHDRSQDTQRQPKTTPQHAAESRGLEGIPSVAGQPPDVANAVTGEEYAAGEQGNERIGDEDTAMADSSTPELPSMVERPRDEQGREGTPDEPGSGREPPLQRAG